MSNDSPHIVSRKRSTRSAKLNRAAFVLSLLALLVSADACRRKTPDAPRSGGRLIIPIYDSALSRSQLDPAAPHYERIVGAIYEGLTRQLTSGAPIEPALAEKWQNSPDGLVWRFDLRRGALFHDDECFPGGVGRETTARDVIYSWERLITSKTLPAGYDAFGRFIEGARELHEGRAEHASGLRAIDDYTLEVHLTTPFVGFLSATAWSAASVTPHEAVERYGARFAEHPVGTGAFRFISWEVDSRAIVARHPRYWKRDAAGVALPYLDAIEYQRFTSSLTAFQSLTNGLTQIAQIPSDRSREIYEIDPTTNEPRPLPQYAALGLQLFRQVLPPAGLYACFQMERETPFTRDVRLRRAVAYALQTAGRLPGAHDAPQGVLLRSLPGAPPNEKGYVYDLKRAEQLLAEAGYPRGRGLPKLRLLTFPGISKSFGFVLKSLRDIGLNVEEVIIPLSDEESSLRGGDFDLFVESWDIYYPDVSAQLFHFLSDAPPEMNAARYRNAQLDALVARANAEQNSGRRTRLVAQIEDLLLDEAVWTTFHDFSTQPPPVIALRADVRFEKPPHGGLALDLRTLWFAKAAAPSSAAK